MKYFLFNTRRILLSYWYFAVLGRKRDRRKDYDCKYFEESGVFIKKFETIYGFDDKLYEAALFNKKIATGKPKRLGANRDCDGDGHYKCLECMKLNYDNSDLINRSGTECTLCYTVNVPGKQTIIAEKKLHIDEFDATVKMLFSQKNNDGSRKHSDFTLYDHNKVLIRQLIS